MDHIRKVSKRCLLLSFMWLLILGAWLAVFVHLSLERVMRINPAVALPPIHHFEVLFLEILAASVFLVLLLLWICCRLAVRRLATSEPAAATPKPAGVNQAAVSETDRRRSLLLISLLQREGRLVDFLQENLQDYDDAQIGAAVRSIQENCKKSLNKYLDLRPVIAHSEGEEITIEPGFDADAIKLTGNASGQPPFQGTLQHHGWRAGRLELPQLSGKVNSDIISPAEVEIG